MVFSSENVVFKLEPKNVNLDDVFEVFDKLDVPFVLKKDLFLLELLGSMQNLKGWFQFVNNSFCFKDSGFLFSFCGRAAFLKRLLDEMRAKEPALWLFS